LGLVGLGKMGGDMIARLTDAGHRVVGFDVDTEARNTATSREGAEAAESLESLVSSLSTPRVVWIMVPHGDPTNDTIDRLVELLDFGDTLVDGGNSKYTESMQAGERAAASGIAFLDVGVSGGVWGRRDGYCLMVGGPDAAYERLEPIFGALAPEGGYARVGASGAGHFVKMVHNAIEYAQLQALGEGFHCLNASGFDLRLADIASLWQRGAVVRSWLLDLLVRALKEDGDDLASIDAYVEDSGMGRWSVEFAVEHSVPTPAFATALFERFSSRDDDLFAQKVVAALRKQFGGHAVKVAAND